MYYVLDAACIPRTGSTDVMKTACVPVPHILVKSPPGARYKITVGRMGMAAGFSAASVNTTLVNCISSAYLGRH
jgi:hypothetical protein